MYVYAATGEDMNSMLSVSIHTQAAQVPPFYDAHVTVYSLVARHQPDFQTNTPKTFVQQEQDVDFDMHDKQQQICVCPQLPLPCPGQNVNVPDGLDDLRGCHFLLPLDHQSRLYKISVLLEDDGKLVEQLPTSLLWPQWDGGRRRVHARVFFTGD